MENSEVKAMLAFGAKATLEANGGPLESLFAPCCGLTLQPGEDLIGAMARVRSVPRLQMEQYLRAVADGLSVEDAHRVAMPAPTNRAQ